MRRFRVLVTLVLFAAATPLHAELVSLEVRKREPFADGQREPFAEGLSFGDVGPYESITAVANFALDPADPRNRRIVDLDLAPRDANGNARFSADVQILTPKDRSKGNGACSTT